MAVDYAVKYEKEINERFKSRSYTDAAVNGAYDFVGVRTVKVYNIPTADMNDYSPSGQNRYGEASELSAAAEELTVKRDRSFTFTIDKRNAGETNGALDAGAALSRQIDRVVVPEIDKYRLSVMAELAGVKIEREIDAENAYESIIDIAAEISDNGCPAEDRVIFAGPHLYKCLKLDGGFIKNTEIAQKMLITGQVGIVDNMRVVLVPSSYLPDGVYALCAHKSAVTAAQKLSEYKIHDNPPGINGWLVEGRVCYDAFVLDRNTGFVGVLSKGQ